MRQAGRYMNEYRALRERYSLLDLCRTPDLATEVTYNLVHGSDSDESAEREIETWFGTP